MKVIFTETYDEMSEESANIIIEELSKKPNMVLGLATGSTPIGTYKGLIKAYNDKKISFKDVITYNLDEYVGLERSHDQSYFYFMHDNLFNHVDVLESNINFPNGSIDQDEAVKKYNAELGENTIDLQILGIGGNGHIAFNEPGTPFDSVTHIVELTEETKQDNKRFFAEGEEVPSHAITMGLKNIMDAKKIIILANGKNKANAVKKLLEGELNEEFPASVLMDHPDVVLIVDKDAAQDVVDN